MYCNILNVFIVEGALVKRYITQTRHPCSINIGFATYFLPLKEMVITLYFFLHVEDEI